MFHPFDQPRNLTREQWRARARAIQSRLEGLSIDELMRGDRIGEPPRIGVQGPHRHGYDPNQPRVPAGHSDGGQWTDDERWNDHPLIGAQFASHELPPLGPLRIRRMLQRALRIIEALRSDNLLNDLFGRPRGTVSMIEIEGRPPIFGSNSRLPLYTSRDQAEADNMRDILWHKYPELARSNKGQVPMDAVYHAETNVLLRAKKELGGTLAGRTLEVVTDRPMCPSCPDILPKVGLELGNPTVTFIGPRGQTRTMRDGRWLD